MSRVSAKYKDRAPRIVRLEDGDDWWFTDGIKGVPVATMSVGKAGAINAAI